MVKNIIGIDPDSKAHGVALYVEGKLKFLQCMTLLEIMDMVSTLSDVEVHIENVCGMSAVFRQKQGGNAAINMKMSNSVGKCQQSQVELERLFDRLGVNVVKHKISKSWKDRNGKAQFEKVTGWVGHTNEDTRSAAYFGFLGVK